MTWDEYYALYNEATRLNGVADSLTFDSYDLTAQAEGEDVNAAQALVAAAAATSDAVRIEGLINTLQSNFTAHITSLTNVLNSTTSLLNGITYRLDNVRDPTKGTLRPAEDVLISLYDLHRDAVLTAGQYDALLLTAAKYDGYGLDCTMYDFAGKTMLM
jgi:hypothetical protein